MENKRINSKWRFKMGNDRSRRDEIRHHSPDRGPPVVYRRKKPDRKRREKIKKRWSVRPDVSLVVVPPGKQCNVICAAVLIFVGVFVAFTGVIVLVILKHLSTVVWGIGIGLLIVGLVIFLAGLMYLLYVCCFRTSTRYKQYIAQSTRSAAEKFEISDVASPLSEVSEPSVASKTTLQTNFENTSTPAHINSVEAHVSQPSEATSVSYATAQEPTTPPHETPADSKVGGDSESKWATPGVYRPLRVRELMEYSIPISDEDEGYSAATSDIDYGTGARTEAMMNSPMNDALPEDFQKLQNVLQQIVVDQSGDGEMMRLIDQQGPIDTSTPLRPRTLSVPITVEGSSRADRHHLSTPPTPIPPSYDQVIRNYRTYSRSTSPSRQMESNV